ncbi:MAG: NAD(P)-dependent oxidoreductase [Syntrophobacterales bacterium CG03_land_8_20_14_0_80_58_14]|nr:MAG: NAD(P)-dependent oxidoreductase [Syntrophobacterales bacterium CG03_land_8_20_14_0_80_58_14]
MGMSNSVKSVSGTIGPVGVIGLGNMGLAMAVNLVGSGFEVVGTDLIAESRNALNKAGGTAVADAGEVGKRCRHIILSLPSEAALHAVCADLSANGARETIVIETGTLPLTAKRKACDFLAGYGITVLDCPLSGTGAQAKNRDLAVYASGDAKAIRKCRPIIDGFARVCYNLGEFGNGMKMKLVANLLVAIHNVAAAEGILLGVRSGLDPATVVKVIGDGAGSSRMFQVRGPSMVDRTWDEAMITNTVWQKDLKLIGEALLTAESPAPLFSATIPIYTAALTSGHADHDTAAVYEVLERMAGLSPHAS